MFGKIFAGAVNPTAILGTGMAMADSLIQSKGQSDINQANITQAKEQTAFQERMSSTAYQRATEDMRQAGLNPMLAYGQGGASAPQGAQGQLANAAPEIGKPIMEQLMNAAELKAINTTTDKTKQDTETAKAQQDLLKAQKTLTSNQARITSKDAEINDAKTQMMRPFLDKLKGLFDSGAKSLQQGDDYKKKLNQNPKFNDLKKVMKEKY